MKLQLIITVDVPDSTKAVECVAIAQDCVNRANEIDRNHPARATWRLVEPIAHGVTE